MPVMRPKGGKVKRKQAHSPMRCRFKPKITMFKYTVAAALMLLSLGGFAQHKVYGVVRDNKGQTLTGASVQLEGIARSAITDEFGQFSISRIANGDHMLSVRFIGFTEHRETVNVNGADVALTITLEESVTLTEEVVVTATRANEKTPTTYTNVGKEAIQKQNFGQDLPFLLNWTPSVVTTSDAGAGIGYTGMRIRGSDATRINVTINGIAYNDSESQGTFWVNIPDIASSTQSIQIQRGVGTSTNGAGAFGGSVNVQTNSLQTDPYAEVNMVAGSFNTQRYTLKTGTGLIKDHWTFDARVSKINSDGYIDRASSDLSSYYISGGYHGKKTIIKAITLWQ
jgi:iron complex outermembrane receptor protein